MMEVSELSAADWSLTTDGIDFKNVFVDENFIRIYSEVYAVKPKYFVVKNSDRLCMALFTFNKGTDILFPCHFMFTTIWEHPHLSEFKRNHAWNVLLSFLKSKYRNIAFRLPVGFFDIRPFYWAGFKAIHKHTYIKDLPSLSYHTNIKRIIHKGNAPYSFSIDNWSADIESLIKRDMLALGFPTWFITRTIVSYQRLWADNKMLIVSGHLNGTLVGCHVMMIDQWKKTAYLFFISKVEGHYKAGFPTLLYHYVFSHLYAEGYKTVDLFGANHASIADFKSKFQPVLQEFFEVRYNRKQALFNQTKEKLKASVKYWLKGTMFR